MDAPQIIETLNNTLNTGGTIFILSIANILVYGGGLCVIGILLTLLLALLLAALMWGFDRVSSLVYFFKK